MLVDTDVEDSPTWKQSGIICYPCFTSGCDGTLPTHTQPCLNFRQSPLILSIPAATCFHSVADLEPATSFLVTPSILVEWTMSIGEEFSFLSYSPPTQVLLAFNSELAPILSMCYTFDIWLEIVILKTSTKQREVFHCLEKLVTSVKASLIHYAADETDLWPI